MRCTAAISWADGAQGRLRRQHAAGQGDQEDRQRHEPERRAEPRQHVVSRVGALPHLNERAVGEADVAGLETGEIPAFGLAEHEGFSAEAVGDANKHALRRRLLLGADDVRQAVEAAAVVRGGIRAELAVDDLPIALRERRRRQDVGEIDDRQRSGDSRRP